jgi:hypothetical protein
MAGHMFPTKGIMVTEPYNHVMMNSGHRSVGLHVLRMRLCVCTDSERVGNRILKVVI